MNVTRLTTMSGLVLCLAAANLSAAELTNDQRSQLLQEATTAYEQGLQSSSSDVASAKDAFTTATGKYRLLVDSGVENPRLYENLGNASLQSGRLGAATAAYEHAAVLAPSDGGIRRHLDHARSLIDGGSKRAEADTTLNQVAGWNQSIPMSLRLTLCLFSWTLLWAALIGWLIVRSSRWKKTAIGAAVLAMLMAASIGWDWSRLPRSEFGVVTTPVALRTHNGDSFPTVFDQPLSDGTRFDVLAHRGNWLYIRLPDDTSGWIPNTSADVIAPPSHPWG